MKNLLTAKLWALASFLSLLSSCGPLMNMPSQSTRSTLGEQTPYTKKLRQLPTPEQKIVVGVYKFKDQTGQYKMQENGSGWSTAIPQGTTAILLKALEDSKWFRPIERENISDLLNERQIIRSTRKEYQVADDGKSEVNDQLPPLLYAGIILEGGIVSYDTNVMTGGVGARYFGLGGSQQYRQDRVTVYLRLVSSMTGEILKTIYTSKNILYTSYNGSFFRYIDTDRLLEADIGFTQNEPVSLAVTEAIEKAVYTLIMDGTKSKLFVTDDKNAGEMSRLIKSYEEEKIQNNFMVPGNKYADQNRGKFSIFGIADGTMLKGDYTNQTFTPGVKGGAKYFLGDNVNAELNAGFLKLENKDIFKKSFITSELNLEYLMLPKYKLSPYVYGGIGTLIGEQTFFKAQIGGGIEYMLSQNLALRLNSQYDLGFDDKWDGLENGKRKDQALHLGLGLNFYFDSGIKKTNKTTKPSKP